MSYTNRRPISRRSFYVCLLLALLFGGFAVLTSPGRPTGAVAVSVTSNAEKALSSKANAQIPIPTPGGTLTKCATSRWLAEGNTNDSNGINTQPANTTTFAYGVGAIGQAFSLNGSTDYVSIPISLLSMNNPSRFTWEACIYPTSLANRNPVVFSKEASGGTGNRAGLQINANGSVCSYMNSSNCAATSGAGLIPINKWTKVTLLYDGANLVTYVDGAQIHSAAAPQHYNNTAPFTIGWSLNGLGPRHFLGRIDEVSFSSCAVPPTPCGCGPAPTPIP